jgi:hypothetical protein
MQDVQTYLEKLSTDAVDCALIGVRLIRGRKCCSTGLAEHLAMLASELERVIEAKGL